MHRYRANLEQIRQSMPDSSLGFQTKDLRPFRLFPLRSEADCRADSLPASVKKADNSTQAWSTHGFDLQWPSDLKWFELKWPSDFNWSEVQGKGALTTKGFQRDGYWRMYQPLGGLRWFRYLQFWIVT